MRSTRQERSSEETMAQLNLANARQDLEARGLDGLLVLSPLHFYYATGHSSWFLNLYGEPGYGAAVIPTRADQPPAALLSDVEELNFRQTAPDFRVSTYPAWVAYADLPTPGEDAGLNHFRLDQLPQEPTRAGLIDVEVSVEKLAKLIDECGLSKGRLGTELNFASGPVLERLRQLLPGVEFVDALELLQIWRAYKTPQEAEWLRLGTELAEAAIETVTASFKPGITAGEIARRYRLAVFEHATSGSVMNARITLRVGPHVLSPQSAGSYVLQQGDAIFMDCGVDVAGYWADMGRAFVLGRASSLQRSVYAALCSGFEAGIAQLKIGNMPAQVIEAGLKAVQEAGLPNYVRGNVGHGIGLHRAPEKPIMSKEETMPLAPGQVISVEFPLYAQGVGAFTLEDTFYLMEDGVKVWNRLPRELVEL